MVKKKRKKMLTDAEMQQLTLTLTLPQALVTILASLIDTLIKLIDR